MALVRNFTCDRDKMVRRQKDGGGKQGIGADNHLLFGSTGSGGNEYKHRSLVRFAQDWTGVKTLVKAEIAIKTEDDSSHFALGSHPKVRAQRLSQSFSDGTGGEGNWSAGQYEWPGLTGGVIDRAYPIDPNTGKPVDNAWVFIDVTDLIKPIVPKTIAMPDGTMGLGGTNYGWCLLSPSELDNSLRGVAFARHTGTAGNRPYMKLTYDPVNRQPDAPVLSAPATSNVSLGDFFEGDHYDPDLDPMSARYIEVREKAVPANIWKLPTTLQSAGSDESLTGHFSVPLSHAAGFLKLQTLYEWRAATRDNGGLPLDWAKATYSAWRDLRITSSAPTVVASNVGSIASMTDALFGGAYSDPESDALAKFCIQMKAHSTHDDAGYADPTAYIWTTGDTTPSADEVIAKVIRRAYGGKAIGTGTWCYRIRAQDDTGVWSAWSYDDFTLTAPFDPEPGNVTLTTQVARIAPVRIALYAMGALRGIGALIGYIDDPMDLGASTYLNAGGEMYFSLPALHPYCPYVEPHKTHYAVEQYYGDRYRVLYAGIITDFDADADTVVFYGTDYLGLLQTAVDERYNPDKADLAADGNGGGGSRYPEKTLDWIIKDQLRYHKGLANSPVGFITLSGSMTALAESATIYSTYTEALPFITGLIDSHKQGTGRECRFYARPTSNTFLNWEWALVDNWGHDRPNIRLEYGGLLNDFRVVALGDFGTRVLGVGQKRGEVKVYRASGTGGMDEALWGRRSKTRFYADIIDQNDLNRRVKEDAAQLAKVGKRMALAIRADMLQPFDGWDVGDSIVIDIERGVVDTSQYGSGGFWTILGAEWRYYSDGHTDLTLTTLPKKSLTAADPDLIPSINPGIPNDWQVGYGVPTTYGDPPSPTPP